MPGSDEDGAEPAKERDAPDGVEKDGQPGERVCDVERAQTVPCVSKQRRRRRPIHRVRDRWRGGGGGRRVDVFGEYEAGFPLDGRKGSLVACAVKRQKREEREGRW